MAIEQVSQCSPLSIVCDKMAVGPSSLGEFSHNCARLKLYLSSDAKYSRHAFGELPTIPEQLSPNVDAVIPLRTTSPDFITAFDFCELDYTLSWGYFPNVCLHSIQYDFNVFCKNA